MTHRDYIRRGGSSAWPSELVPGAQDFQRWDASQYALINGTDGGSWNPVKPITIGEAGGFLGIISLTLNNAASQFTGGAVTTLGGRIICAGAIPPGVTPSRSRTVTWRLWEFPIVSSVSTLADTDIKLIQDPKMFGVVTGPEIEIILPSKFLHRGATLQSIALNYRITQRPTATQLSVLGQAFVRIGAANPGGTVQAFPNGASALFSVGLAWAASTSKTVGSYVTPTTGNANGFYFKATSISGTGTTGSSEPTWPSIVGATVIDNAGANQIVWTCVGLAGVGTHKQMTDPSTFYANGQAQTLTFQLDPAVTNTVDPEANYYIVIPVIEPYALLHSIQLTYSGISSLAFE